MFAYVQEEGSLKTFPKDWVGYHYGILTYERELTPKELKKHDMRRIFALTDLSEKHQEAFQKIQLIEKETITNILKGLVR